MCSVVRTNARFGMTRKHPAVVYAQATSFMSALQLQFNVLEPDEFARKMFATLALLLQSTSNSSVTAAAPDIDRALVAILAERELSPRAFFGKRGVLL